MARQVIALALIFVALVGAVSAAKEGATTPTASPATESAVTPTAEAVDAVAPSTGANGETIGEEANAPTGELGPATAEALGPAGDEGKTAGKAAGLKVSFALAAAGVVGIAGVLSF